MTENANKTRRYLRVRVNPIKCTAFGFCAEFLPEVFELDDWGYAWVQRPDVPLSLAETAYQAARLCPTGAILVEVVEEPRSAVDPHGQDLAFARNGQPHHQSHRIAASEDRQHGR